MTDTDVLVQRAHTLTMEALNALAGIPREFIQEATADELEILAARLGVFK